jgi:hypothetical protein
MVPMANLPTAAISFQKLNAYTPKIAHRLQTISKKFFRIEPYPHYNSTVHIPMYYLLIWTTDVMDANET